MKIAIDASRAINEKAGIGRYTLELVRELTKSDLKNTYLLLFSFMRSSRHKEKIIKEFRALKNVEVKILRIPGNLKEKVWGWKLPWFRRLLKDADIFYAPSFLEVNLGLNLPQVVTIYDLTTFLFPEHLGKKMSEFFNLKTKKACLTATKIIAISKSTKNDLEKILKIDPKKITVVYPGQNVLGTPTKNLPQNLKAKSYVLVVGTIEPRKNLINLFKAYAILPPRLQEKYPLAIVGARGWNTGKTYDALEHLKLKDKVKFLGFVSDSVLAKLYKEAMVFVYPSLYEGFGFPVLEALSFNTPVVTSNNSSLPEVAGKAAILVDPQDPKSISSGLQKLLEHKEEISLLKENARSRIGKFSWEKTAREILVVFKEVVKKTHEA
ncbi:MAG: Glycosyl transferase, group 1 [Berkelbacteria bacterium GW2011_GWA1_36_9]|uniref:Glycosyl transferase, group 1 n=1 Tax=Berkelbacteria bacterium GW2011_GWA1_36_9 TaxID=1618331 RepID=A0A0G0FLQ1_9BACT|nr:MAG: Glycosyl transferase, group 1 [Berkelbacteria bacterium GW2011_GWA1_36_9]